jgi:hypothetical protein
MTERMRMLALIDTFQDEPGVVREIARWMVNGAEGADHWLADDTLDTEDDDDENRAAPFYESDGRKQLTRSLSAATTSPWPWQRR